VRLGWRRRRSLPPDVAGVRDEILRDRQLRAWSPSRSVRENNELAYESRRFELRLRESETGRRAIESFLDDPSLELRRWAAFMTLKWNPELALKVIKPMTRRDFIARVNLNKYEEGTWDLDWEPPSRRSPARRSKKGTLAPSKDQIDATIAVHSTTMSGGFLNSLVVCGPSFDEAIAGYRAVGLKGAARVVEHALATIPQPIQADHDARAAVVDGLPDKVGEELEHLSDKYQALFPSDSILFDAIERFNDADGI
jgi:hypothetical protein